MATENAITTAVAALLPDDDDPQLGLFGEPRTEAGKVRAAGRGPGRPLGARNKRTERTVAWLLAWHKDPRQVLLEIAEAHTDDLAALLGCTPFQALQEKRLAATAVMPFIHARMPIAVDVTQRKAVYLTIVDGQGEQVEDAGAGLVVGVLDSVEYQQMEDAGRGEGDSDGR